MMKFKEFLLSEGDERAWNQYQTRAKEISNLLKSIEGSLKTHYKRAEKQKENWGFAGDLGHVKELLDDIDEFLGN
jgi:hypothetical protein